MGLSIYVLGNTRQCIYAIVIFITRFMTLIILQLKPCLYSAFSISLLLRGAKGELILVQICPIISTWPEVHLEAILHRLTTANGRQSLI